MPSLPPSSPRPARWWVWCSPLRSPTPTPATPSRPRSCPRRRRWESSARTPSTRRTARAERCARSAAAGGERGLGLLGLGDRLLGAADLLDLAVAEVAQQGGDQ